MTKRILGFLAISFGVIFFGVGVALALPTPNTSSWYDDDDTELFLPNDIIRSFEIFDWPDLVSYVSSEFGFYFGSDDPTIFANQVTIFGPEDLSDANLFSFE